MRTAEEIWKSVYTPMGEFTDEEFIGAIRTAQIEALEAALSFFAAQNDVPWACGEVEKLIAQIKQEGAG